MTFPGYWPRVKPKIVYQGWRKVVFYGNRGLEVVKLVKASKDYICKECKKPIKTGTYYYNDKITYVKRLKSGRGKSYPWYHRVCMNCWKGPKPLGTYTDMEVEI